ncbi:MAG: hypothetical protein QOH24_685 [Verrucomicrobiota bacterium]
MRRILACGVSVVVLCQPCFGGVRHFGYLYEAPTAPPGALEVENYVTGKFGDDGSGEIDFRHELELGVTNHLQAGIYVANWSYARNPDDHRVHYDTASVELIYNFTNPVADPIGVSVYQEVSGGRRALELETKLIAQKNFGPLILAYNFTVETAWEAAGLSQSAGELQHALGASYEIGPRLSIGLEMVHEIIFPNWRNSQSTTDLFIGPNVSYRSNRWFATLTALAQVTDAAGEPDFQVRLIFGVAL